MSLIANSLLSMAELYAQIRGRQKDLTINGNQIEVSYTKPTSTNEKYWDSNDLQNANIYLSGYSNPLKLDTSNIHENRKGEIEGELGLIPMERYKLFMQLKTAKQGFATQTEDLDKTQLLLIANMVIGIVILIAIAALWGQI